jgi:salicylate hydroxylase
VKELDDLGDWVRVTTSSGETTDADAVIGADGLWSTVRQFVLHDGPPRISGHIAYRAVLPMDEVPEASRRNDMMAWAGPRTHLVHYPLHTANLLNLVAVFHSKRYQEGWDAYGDPEELTESFAGQVPEVLNLLAKIDAWRMWVLCDREPVKDWSRGRVTLLGDAAHPMLQYIAQGAAMSMEDAVCLAQCVEAAGGDFAAAFAEYPRLRYLRTGRAQMTARLYGEVFHARDATREIRNAFLAPWGPEQHYQGMSWLYA